MKFCFRSFQGAAPAVLAFLLVSSVIVPPHDAHGHDESAGKPRSARTIQKDYDNDYIFNSWSAVLTVEGSGSVEVAETYDVTTDRIQRGIIRNMGDLYNSLLIYDVACSQGYAVHEFSQSAGNRFTFGYYTERAPGRHLFTLAYHAAGMIVPAGKGVRLQWRWNAEKNPNVDSIRIILPGGVRPVRVSAVEAVNWSRYLQFEKELQYTITGNTIIVHVKRSLQHSLDIAVDLPASVIDARSMREFLNQITERKEFSTLQEYRTAVSVHDDRTIERKDAYLAAPDNADRTMMMPYEKRFQTAYWTDQNRINMPESVYNTLILYGLDREPCKSGGNSGRGICIPFREAGTARTELRYGMWGNYNPNDPFFLDFRFPPAMAKMTERVSFEIALPAFVKREEVRVALYLVRGFNRGVQLREVTYEGRWNGNRLVGAYPACLYDEQYLLARVFLPAAGFRDPGFLKKTEIYLSHFWCFYRNLFIAGLAFFAMLLASAPALIWLNKRRKNAVIAAASVSVKTRINEKAVSAVRAEDPVFVPEVFLDRARITAGKIQTAWSRGDMRPARNFVSQGVYNRLRLRLGLMREYENMVNIMDAFTVRSINLMKASFSRSYETLYLHINASVLDVMVSAAATGEERRRSLDRARKSYFTEIYSFTRKRGAVTDAAKNLLAGHCPACGSVPDSFDASNRCTNCGALCSSGEFDWVLSGITQGGEWRPDLPKDAPGLAALESEGLHLDHWQIEDRATCLFWQWVAAQAAGSAALLARDATDNFLAGFTPVTGYFAETSVSLVELMEVASVDGGVRADVLVHWNAARARGKVPEHREHRLTLVLPAGATSLWGFADHGCDSCGAPLPESGGETCPRCGSGLQRANSDWLLNGVEERK
ncbi:MAG: hypothetical protein JXA07_12230 [Spirochaetes bacterium]|nr:hypothetical protein [Spirochaetota bacterium]